MEGVAFVGGHVVLDFLNTAGGKGKVRDVERLIGFADAAAWAEAASLLESGESVRLLADLKNHREQAETSLSRLRQQREIFFRVFSAVCAGGVAAEPDQSRFEAELKSAISVARLEFNSVEKRAGWQVGYADAGLEIVRHRLSLCAQDLVSSEGLKAVRMCEACSWMFIDRSKAHRRRWCSMAACGNRAKASRHYHRTG